MEPGKATFGAAGIVAARFLPESMYLKPPNLHTDRIWCQLFDELRHLTASENFWVSNFHIKIIP